MTTELLPTLNADVLQALARRVGLPKTVTRKADLVVELDSYVRVNLPSLVAGCSEMEKRLLAEAAYNRGCVDPTVFEAKYGVEAPLPENPRWGRSNTPLLLLLDYQDETWTVPVAIAERLRQLLPRPDAVSIQTVETLPTIYTPPEERWSKPEERPVHVYESERIVFPELRSILKLVQAGKLRVTEKGCRPTDGAVKLISEVLVVPDFSVEAPPEEADKWTERGGAIRAHA
jgi:hypothetical protein